MTARRRPPRRVRVEARAKLNLGLVVGPPRPDGFHDLATFFQSVSLHDTLLAERTVRGFTLRVRHEHATVRGRLPAAARADVPPGPANLVLRAARLAHERLGLPGGVRLVLVKRIPSRAGLGGGSADAAAALAAVARLHGVRLGRDLRLALALELGSDVPFSITGGSALGTGRGERLRPVRLTRPFRAVVAMPAWHVSTADAFRQIDRIKYGLTGWERNLRSAANLARKRVSPSRAFALGNTFERVLGEREADFVDLRSRLRAAGLESPHLTGSGSAVFGLVPPRASIRAIVSRFRGDEPLYAVRTTGAGLRITTPK
jgi:4-diphosphocytidyl-2-C-methyl-D-erythritol kinase